MNTSQLPVEGQFERFVRYLDSHGVERVGEAVVERGEVRKARDAQDGQMHDIFKVCVYGLDDFNGEGLGWFL